MDHQLVGKRMFMDIMHGAADEIHKRKLYFTAKN